MATGFATTAEPSVRLTLAFSLLFAQAVNPAGVLEANNAGSVGTIRVGTRYGSLSGRGSTSILISLTKKTTPPPHI